ncbi:hypothetical protein BC936DRAFT_143975 [Jimgerdemannia flammicorona]|uniref:Uncharacterized protein n=1 Tax=Jimgerdemannia flammicorona TaxID=994334 RepID=A0A432ZYC7_9FUNG|nr:hypothetical protein BC936DRAFT_143975 [Jimgerdemannia flammicorona]
MQIRQENQTLYFQVSNQKVAQAVARLNGFTFAEQKLTITVVNTSGPLQPPQRNPPAAAPHLSTIDTLRIFLQSRWQPESKYLNLENMDTDPNLRQARIRGPGTVQGTGNVGAVIMKLSAEMFGEDRNTTLYVHMDFIPLDCR